MQDSLPPPHPPRARRSRAAAAAGSCRGPGRGRAAAAARAAPPPRAEPAAEAARVLVLVVRVGRQGLEVARLERDRPVLEPRAQPRVPLHLALGGGVPKVKSESSLMTPKLFLPE